MSFFFSKHHTLHYVTRGNRTQPPLLLLHGFLGSHQDFAPVLPTLSLYFYCIVPDLPGHGQTKTEPDAYTFPKTAESLLALLSHLNICETHLLGYSMGGRLALYLACEFPDCFISVVLESSSPGLKTAEQRVERRKRDGAIAHRLQTTPLSTFLHQWYRNPLFSSLQQHPDKYVAMLQCRKNNDPVALASALQGLGTGQQPSLWKALESMERPLLLIVGGLDTKFVAINDEMVTTTLGRRGVRLEVIENCGHNVHLEAPAIYAHVVLLFLVGRL